MKIKLNKRLISLLTASGVAIGGMAAGIAHLKENEETEIGYEDINSILNIKVDDNDFVILDIGDHNTIKTHFQNRKMTYCNDKDISLGVIISTNSETESQIYNDVEYIKGIIRDYKINLPVYLNIDEIMTNDNLNLEMKTKLIKDFLEKCSANNIYVGLHGTDTNLCYVEKYCAISGDYDAYLVKDKEEIEYTGSYNLYKDLNGEIIKKIDLEEIIENKDLNNSEKFFSDSSYKVTKKDENTLTEIALTCGLSVNELLEFNNLSKGEVQEGTILRIPSIIDTKIPIQNTTHFKVEKPLRGCDMSYAQGTDIDWEALQENFEFIILKCSQGTELDNCFETNAKNCNINNIPLGVYCYNGYDAINCSDFKQFKKKQEEQADFVLSALKNKKIDYPVYFDIEAPNNQSLSSRLSREDIQLMLDIWYNKMSSFGYIPGIYCNQSGFEYISSCVDYNLSEKFEMWIAGGEQYLAGKDDIELEDVRPSSILEEKENVNMAQSTDSAINCGAGNANNHLDINFSKVDYTKKTSANNELDQAFEIKEFKRTDINLLLGGILTALTVVPSIIGIAKIKSKTKKRRDIF